MSRDRRIRRRSTHIKAWVALDGGFAKRGCTIIDLSDTGARVLFHDTPPHASTLRLTFLGDVRVARPARVVWRRNNVLGLQFVVSKAEAC
jgi:hypothetical protein